MTDETNNRSDPWKAVHRIKLRHEAVVDAAIVAVNCYEWQGEQQAQFLVEAMDELKQAVVALRPDVSWAKRPSNHPDEGGRG